MIFGRFRSEWVKIVWVRWHFAYSNVSLANRNARVQSKRENTRSKNLTRLHTKRVYTPCRRRHKYNHMPPDSTPPRRRPIRRIVVPFRKNVWWYYYVVLKSLQQPREKKQIDYVSRQPMDKERFRHSERNEKCNVFPRRCFSFHTLL